jgi:hypothetical protein
MFTASIQELSFSGHGLISDSTYKMFTACCNYSRYVSEYYPNSILPLCWKVMSQVSRETSKFADKYMLPLMYAFPQYFHNPKLSVHKSMLVFSFIDYLMRLLLLFYIWYWLENFCLPHFESFITYED